MKSPYQISKELKVSPQSVYQKVERLQDQLAPYIQRNGKKILIDEQGETLLKSTFSNMIEQGAEQDKQKIEQSIEQEVEQGLINQLNKENEYLREQNKLLLQELSKQREEISKEREQNQIILEKEREHSRNIAEQLAKLNENQQILLLSEQKKNIPLISDTTDTEGVGTNQENKKGIFKFFSKKNR